MWDPASHLSSCSQTWNSRDWAKYRERERKGTLLIADLGTQKHGSPSRDWAVTHLTTRPSIHEPSLRPPGACPVWDSWFFVSQARWDWPSWGQNGTWNMLLYPWSRGLWHWGTLGTLFQTRVEAHGITETPYKEDKGWGILGVLSSQQRWSGSSGNFGNLKIGPGSWTPRAGMTEVGRASWEGAV